MSELIRNFTSVLFPFRYDIARKEQEAFNAPILRKNGKEDRLWEPARLQVNHLKENVSSMIGDGGEGGIIGDVYSFNDSLRREMEIPEARTELILYSRGREEPSRVRLEDIRLALFDTGVGFLELTFRCEGRDPEEMLDINYFLCEVKSGKNYLEFTQRLGKDESRQIRLPLLELVEKLTASLGTIHDFDSGDSLRYIHGKPLVFSYLLLDRYPEDLGRLLFNLRTNFKASYQVPAEEMDLTRAKGINHPFENVYWGTSLNGTVCCACLTGNPQADDFFQTVFPSNLRHTYSLLFLLRQHQRFALENYQSLFLRVGQGLEDGTPKQKQEAYARIRGLQSRCDKFQLKCIYQNPSSVEHINEFDRFLRINLRVKENLVDFAASMARLESMAQAIKEKIDKLEENRKRLRQLRQERVLSVIAAFWSVFLLLDECWGLAEKLMGREIPVLSIMAVIPVFISAIPALPLVVEQIKKNREIRELREECGE